MKKSRFLLALLCSGCLSNALGEGAPRGSERGDRQGSAPPPLAGIFQAVDAVFCPLDAVGGGDNDLLLFPNNAQVVVDCTTTQMVCWTQADSTDITYTTASLTITDAASGTGIGQDGRGSCTRVLAGTYRNMILDLDIFKQVGAVGRRVGVCVDSSGVPQGRPCRQNSDCQTSASHTCDVGSGTSGRQADITGAFLCSSSADCGWTNEGFGY